MGNRSRMGDVMRFFFRGVQVVTPWGIRAAIVIGWSFIITLSTMWVGVPTALENLSNHWEQELVRRGAVNAYARPFNYAVRVIACIVIAFEWVCFSFTTVYLIVFLFWLF